MGTETRRSSNSSAPRPRGGRVGARSVHGASALVLLTLVAALLGGCGGSSAASTTAPSVRTSSGASTSGAPITNPGAASADKVPLPTNGQYLIKALAVSMEMADTRRAAADLQSWVAGTDPQSSTAGVTYDMTGTGAYRVTIAFSVQATMYPAVQRYLADYAGTHGGRLLSLRESVQDVSSSYVDTEARLKTLRTEQQRLLTLMANAANLSDLLTIEQRLATVESNIEATQAQLNRLTNQTTFYTVNVTLEPTGTTRPTATRWDPGTTLSDAVQAALIFAQVMGTIAIWLGVFSLFGLPVLAVWLVWRRLRRRRPPVQTPPLPAHAPVR